MHQPLYAQVNVHLGDVALNQHHMTLLEAAIASHPGKRYLSLTRWHLPITHLPITYLSLTYHSPITYQSLTYLSLTYHSPITYLAPDDTYRGQYASRSYHPYHF